MDRQLLRRSDGLRAVVVYAALALFMMGWHWGGTVADSKYYYELALHFDHRFPASHLTLPFAYRIMTPWIASHSPFSIRDSFAFINYSAVVAAGLLLRRICRNEGFSESVSSIGGLLIVLSAPTFFYAPYLLTDPTLLLWEAALVWALRARQAVWVLPIGLIAVTTKEDALVAIAAAFAWTVFERRWREMAVWSLLLLSSGACLLAIRRHFEFLGSYSWTPSLAYLSKNLESPLDYLSVAAGIGIVGPLAVLGYLHPGRLTRDARRFWAFLSLSLLAVPLFALVSARFDGRFFWTMYPAAIPLAAAGVDHLLKSTDLRAQSAPDVELVEEPRAPERGRSEIPSQPASDHRGD